MSATNEKSDTQKLTFRRYKDGDSKHVPWNKQIFQASHTYNCSHNILYWYKYE